MTAEAPPQALPAETAVRKPPLVVVKDLVKHFPVRRGILARVRQHVRAVESVSFEIGRGETLGLVGESGCGKTTVGRCVLRLIPATAGLVEFDGQDVLSLERQSLRVLRQRMQIIFQDPFGSLNPRMTVGGTVGEPLWVHGVAKGAALRRRVGELLEKVGLGGDAIGRYPHEFSGGQRQRIGIARALALDPAFIVCDEPTSALDVSIRAQVINLLMDLQQQLGISYLMISHDLAAVRHISHLVAVMYLGRIVERAPTDLLFSRPRHPYTRVLLSAIPIPDPARRHERIVTTDDDVPSPINVPPGCPFHPRCPLYVRKGQPEMCRTAAPALRPMVDAPAHLAACHFAEETEQALVEKPLAPPAL